jgi:peptidyl-prolyl cis-trans isomerase D
MLQAIRDKAQGWIAWAIVILISIPFALWGIQEYLGVGGEREVAVINGDPITERTLQDRVRSAREAMRASLGDAYRADLFDDASLRRRALDALIEEKVLIDEALDWNMRIGDAQARVIIASIPAFQRNGRFDPLAYETSVRNQGLSRAGFEQLIRQELLLSQVRGAVSGTAFVTEHQIAQRVRLRDEQRDIAYLRIPAGDFNDLVDVSEERLRAFYDESRQIYATPERVRLAYLVLDPATLADFVDVTEEGLREYYDTHRGDFVEREQRAMRHILIATEPGAGVEAQSEALREAEALREQLVAGADFAELAAARSDDPGSANDGGDLGWVERGIMVPEFEEAGFALEPGQVSGPVKTDFGYHLIEVTEVRGDSESTFEDVRTEVEASLRRVEAENLYFDYAERLAVSSYENASSLVPASEDLGLPIQASDWLTRDAVLQGVLASPRVTTAAFSDDVLLDGHNSELLEPEPLTAIVLRVAEHEPAGFEAFDDVRERVEVDFVRTESAAMAAQRGESLLTALRAGEQQFADVRANNSAWEGGETAGVTRNAASLSPELLETAFGIAPPTGDETRFAGTAAANGDYLLISVSGAEPGDLEALAEAERATLQQRLSDRLGGYQQQEFTAALRQAADVKLLPVRE